MPRRLEKCANISDFESYSRSLDISYDKFFLRSKIKLKDKNIICNTTSLGLKYLDILLKHTTVVTLTDEEFKKYRYQPKLYCYEKYGTLELWGLLLRVNNMVSVTDFNVKKFKAFNEYSIMTILNEILILEDDNITKNRVDMEN